MKKIILTLIALNLMLPTFAGGVGYINYDKVITEYRFAQKTLREIEAKGKEIQQFLSQKEEEFDKLESPIQKKKFEADVQAQLKTKELAFNDFRNKKEELVYNRIHAVSEKIRLEK